MKTLLALALWFIAGALVTAADKPSIVGREFTIYDDWAGQELAFIKKGDSILAVWRVLGSGRPVLSEIEYPVDAKNPRQCVFEVQLRDGSRGKVKVEFGDETEVRAYLSGIKIQIEEKTPNQRPERNAGAASSSTSTPTPGVAHP